MSNSASSTGLSGNTLLQIVFITLKLCNVIHWSWWYVMLPTLIPLGIVIVFGALWIILEVLKEHYARKARKS